MNERAVVGSDGFVVGAWCAAALIASYLAVALLRRWAFERQLLDIPNERSSHTRPTPRGGGLAIAVITLIGVIAAALDPAAPQRALIAYGLGAALIAAVGAVDDVRSLPAAVRLLVHFIGALAVLGGTGAWLAVELPALGVLRLGWMGWPLTILWIVGLTNAYNFIDGIDGLAGSQAVLGGLMWAVLGWSSGHGVVAGVGLLLAAASLGFLLHNWPPATIFMGDVGSGFLGCSFAIVPLLTTAPDPRLPLVGVLFVWPILFDTSLTFLRRLLRGENVFQAHRSHLYQRLVIAGLPHQRVTALYLGLTFAGGLAGLAWQHGWPGHEALLLTLPCAGLALWVGTAQAEKRAALTRTQ